jgi:DNA-binding response OmpR family regulator
MAKKKSYLKGKMILAVDDEEDILDTIVEALETARVDRAQDYRSAVRKINEKQYDLAVLDIMGVDGLKLQIGRASCRERV